MRVSTWFSEAWTLWSFKRDLVVVVYLAGWGFKSVTGSPAAMRLEMQRRFEEAVPRSAELRVQKA